jgi:hypothetical protein
VKREALCPAKSISTDRVALFSKSYQAVNASMAIHQQRRENLLLEATAYRRRALFRGLNPLAVPSGSAARHSDSVAAPGDRESWLWDWLSAFRESAEWELFVGLRGDGSWSIYFDEQPVLQFNCDDQLRRVFAGGQRFVAAQGSIRLLDRSTVGGHVSFREVELDGLSQQRLDIACRWFLRAAADVLQPGGGLRMGLVPDDDESWLPGLQQRIRQLALRFEIAHSPRVNVDG